MSASKALWFSTGVAAADRAYYSHKARKDCIMEAINALGRLRSEHGFTIDQLPADINDARQALWKAWHAENARRPELVPAAEEAR